MNTFYVYILKCSDNLYYTGHTDNLEQRLSQHKLILVKNCFTAKRLPVDLVWHQIFSTRDAAFQAERRIKKWTRKKKEALINGDWEILSRLSRSKKCNNSLIDPSTSSG